MIMFKTTPENTWNPWKPVIKKKKSANIGFPYSLTLKLAPSTTSLAVASLAKLSSLDNMIFCLIVQAYYHLVSILPLVF